MTKEMKDLVNKVRLSLLRAVFDISDETIEKAIIKVVESEVEKCDTK